MTGSVSHSLSDHTRSVNPAAIAGVRCRHRPPSLLTRKVRTGQQIEEIARTAERGV